MKKKGISLISLERVRPRPGARRKLQIDVPAVMLTVAIEPALKYKIFNAARKMGVSASVLVSMIILGQTKLEG